MPGADLHHGGVHEVGVLLELPEPYAGQLQAWREELGDPHADTVPPHVTLLPPTQLPEQALPDAEAHLREVAASGHPFDIHLRGTATFRPVSPVVFVPLVAGISDCEVLEQQVRSGPLARPTSFPYHPHVTVAHDLPEPALDHATEVLSSYDARFRVERFTLFERGPDGVWQPQCDFPLGGA